MSLSRRRMPSETLRYLETVGSAPWRRRTRFSWSSTRTAGSFVNRHRLAGSAFLLLTIVAGYMAADTHATREKPPVIIKEAATRYGVSEELIAAVIDAESQFNPRAVSNRGAQGLMQLMPATAATLGVEDPFSPRDNVDGGVRHLRGLIDRFENNLPLALAAYNAGEVAVRAHKGIPPYPQTRAYVRKILRQLERNAAKAPPEWNRPPAR